MEWYFPKIDQKGFKKKPKNSEFFKGREIYEVLLREATQNSMDASDGSGIPVKVFFSFYEINKKDSEKYFSDLLEHAKSAGIIENFSQNTKIRCLNIEDYNTTGLEGSEDIRDEKSEYVSFWMSEGYSSKESESSAGRWGLGKNVFNLASELRSFLGVTKRKGDSDVLVNGQSILESHILQEVHYEHNGRFFIEKEEKKDFCNFFKINRDSPGLSIIVPFLKEEIIPESLLKAAIIHCSYAILTGQLEIVIKENSINKEINKETIKKICEEITFSDYEMQVYGLKNDKATDLVCFIEECLKIKEENFISIKEENKKNETIKDMIADKNLIKNFEEKFNSGEILALKLPLYVKKIKKEEKETFFKIFLKKKKEEKESARIMCFRSGIYVSDAIRSGKNIKYWGLLTAEDKIISEFLGDAEEPAHTEWNNKSGNLEAKYDKSKARKSLTFVKKSLKNFYDTIFNTVSDDKDYSFLSDIFYIKNLKGKGDPNHEPPDPPPDIDRSGYLEFSQYEDSIKLISKKENLKTEIIFAYDVFRGNPFSSYSKYDFMIKEENIICDKTEFEIMEENRLMVLFKSQGSYLQIGGFDPKRDLIFKASEIKDDQEN
ncbi:MAG: hypothetical protein AB1637_08640 [Elusimicrobiota bacterium]